MYPYKIVIGNYESEGTLSKEDLEAELIASRVNYKRAKELEKENEELKAELKKVITHYQRQTLAIKDRLELSNCSDIELSDAYYILDLSETWLRDNYGHMKLDWF